jgi:hypothetical protein
MKFYHCPCQQDSTVHKRKWCNCLYTNYSIGKLSQKAPKLSFSGYLCVSADLPSSTCQKQQGFRLPMSPGPGTETTLTHIRRSRDLPCSWIWEQGPRLPLPMSRETSLSSAHVNSDSLLLMSRETSLCSAHVNKRLFLPMSREPHASLPRSTEISLPMSRDTSLCSAHVNRDFTC